LSLPGHFGSPYIRNEPDAVIKSAAATNIKAKENKTAFNTGEIFFIGFPPFLLIIGMLAD
jgi:hypothetical protein